MSTEIQGSCQGGQVRFAVHGPFERFRLCYCSRCRKLTGSAHASNLFIGAESFRRLAGENAVETFDLPTAQYFASAFYPTCGSPAPRISRRDGSVVIPAGVLDGEPEVRPQLRIYCADQAEWSRDVDAIPRSEGRPA